MQTNFEKSTKTLITKMLKENTGRAIMDSGGAYGRNWERNQNVNFEKTPRVIVGDWNGVLDFTVNVYHYLNEVLILDEFSQRVNRYLNSQRKKGIDAHWVQDCADLLADKYGVEVKDGVVNTYNYDTNLSQVLQFMIFGNGEDFYCLLQIHGGCDVRGGYTDTQCFRLTGWLTGFVDLDFELKDGTLLDNRYYGYKLSDEDGKEYEITQDNFSNVNFTVCDDVYIYA